MKSEIHQRYISLGWLNGRMNRLGRLGQMLDLEIVRPHLPAHSETVQYVSMVFQI